MTKKELIEKCDNLKKEIRSYYDYDFKKLNKLCGEMYRVIDGKKFPIRYTIAIYTVFKNLFEFSDDQINKIGYCFYYDMIIKISKTDRVYTLKSSDTLTYSIDDIGICYILTTGFMPRRISDNPKNTYEYFSKCGTLLK